jgi:hypothetical protein
VTFPIPGSVSPVSLISTAGSREYYIRKIMTTYNYDRTNAEKAYEYMKYKRASVLLGNHSLFKSLGLGCGTIGAIYARPF